MIVHHMLSKLNQLGVLLERILQWYWPSIETFHHIFPTSILFFMCISFGIHSILLACITFSIISKCDTRFHFCLHQQNLFWSFCIFLPPFGCESSWRWHVSAQVPHSNLLILSEWLLHALCQKLKLSTIEND